MWAASGAENPELLWLPLVDRAPGRACVQFDFPEGVFVARNILLQDCHQGLGLLRTEVDSLKIADLDLAFVLLVQGSENEEEIPDIYPHLHAVGIVLAIVGRIDQVYGVLLRNICHKKISVASLR